MTTLASQALVVYLRCYSSATSGLLKLLFFKIPICMHILNAWCFVEINALWHNPQTLFLWHGAPLFIDLKVSTIWMPVIDVHFILIEVEIFDNDLLHLVLSLHLILHCRCIFNKILVVVLDLQMLGMVIILLCVLNYVLLNYLSFVFVFIFFILMNVSFVYFLHRRRHPVTW